MTELLDHWLTETGPAFWLGVALASALLYGAAVLRAG